MNDRGPRRGHYLGTELNERWWRRYARDGFLARGLGDWWLDDEALYFHRRLTQAPLVIAFADVVGLSRGSWHAGQWAGRDAVVKVAWRRDGDRLCSGFVLARDPAETAALMREIGSRARRAGVGDPDGAAG
jgi:hypothetical protein